jgi:long-chain acyl-CoA synthetase
VAKEEDFEAQVAMYEPLWIKQYDQNVRRNLPEPKETLKDVLLKWVAVQPDKPHIIYKDRILTYQESNAAACRLANALLRLGSKKGDRLSILLPNIPEVIIAFMACYKTGIIAVGYNPRSAEAEIKANLADNGAETVIVTAAYADKVINILEKGETALKNVLIIDYAEKDQHKDKVFDFYQLIDKENDKEPDIEVFPDDVQILYYTGGTTGVSKGCCHTNKGIIGHEHAFMEWFAPAMGDADTRIIMNLPMTHGYGINCGINWCLVAGGTVIALDTADTDHILEAINNHEPTIWPSVPALINQIVYHPKVKESKIWALKLVVCGSAPLPVQSLLTFRKYTNAKVAEGFGMSEGINATTFNRISDGGKPGSIGVPFPDTDMLIVDSENGQTLMPPNQKGEIIWRGPQLIKEYWRNPKETAYAIRHGWLYSGDIGYMDEDGYFYIVDRKKDMMDVGGFNVFPREIDELLCKHPKIFASSTVGVPEPRLGEVPMSFVVVKPGEEMSKEDVKTYCHDNLTAYKVPRYVEFVDAIPLTKNNKPDKELLKKRGKKIVLDDSGRIA